MVKPLPLPGAAQTSLPVPPRPHLPPCGDHVPTQVYCSLRTKEAAQRLDTAAQKLTLDSAEPGGVYWLPVSGELIRPGGTWDVGRLDELFSF